MRFCGGFLGRKPLSCPKKGHETGSAARESVGSALLAIDHADCDPALETGLAKGVERLDGGSAGRDDVLDEADPLARLVRAFEAVRRPVLLRLLADDQERKPRRERGGGGEGDGAQLRAGEPDRVRLVLGDRRGDVLAEGGEQVGPRLEAVLVQVVARACGRSGARTRLRGTRARGWPPPARPASWASRSQDVPRLRDQTRGLRPSSVERGQRAVGEVEVDPLARPRPRRA